jgi:hypothetical protein
MFCPECAEREFGPSGWDLKGALYVKRLLLFEPRTILSSVPYQLP